VPLAYQKIINLQWLCSVPCHKKIIDQNWQIIVPFHAKKAQLIQWQCAAMAMVLSGGLLPCQENNPNNQATTTHMLLGAKKRTIIQ